MLTRRRLLSGAGLALCFAALGRSRSAAASSRWGALVVDPAGILDLPAGFSYTILERAGDPMSDGYRVPARPDGMACFEGPDGTLILMRNHENALGVPAQGPYLEGQSPPPEAYDPDGMGGVSRLVLEGPTCTRISSNMVLMGTSNNCAGGPSPWGWLSCEESVEINGEHRHGYVFACPIDAASVQPPDRKPGFGRCFHEAAAVDPSTNITYLTEDRVDSCLYRFVPDAIAEPFVGKLQALAIVDQPGFSTGALEAGALLEVAWIDLDDPDPDQDTLRIAAQAKGAALILRGEGMWFHAGQVFFSATIGGAIGKGQIFRLIDPVVIDPKLIDPSEGAKPTLEVLVSSADPEQLDMPDNITVAPWGELFLVEDGPATNAIRWLDASGQLFEFGRTSLSEITGICFAPDARAMFLNIQGAGLTLAITGPFVDAPSSPSHAPERESDAGCSCSSAATPASESGLSVGLAALLGAGGIAAALGPEADE